MRPDKRSLLRWGLMPLAAAAVMLIVELCCNFSVLFLPGERLVPLSFSGVSVEYAGAPDSSDDEAWEGEWEEEEWDEEWEEEPEEGFLEFDDESGTVHSGSSDQAFVLEGSGTSLPLPFEGYVSLLTLEGTAPAATAYTVTWTRPDGSTGSADSWFAGFLEEDSIRINSPVTGMTLTLRGDELAVSGASVDNRFQWNARRMLLSVLVTLAAWLLIVFRDWYAAHMPFAFLTVALAAGIWLCAGVPVNIGFSYDDQIHLRNAFELAGGGQVPAPLDSLAEGVWKLTAQETNLELDTLKDQQALARLMQQADTGTVPGAASHLWEFSYTGYLPQIAGIWIARLLGMGFRWQCWLARLFNMLAYVGCTFAGLMVLRRFRFTLAAVALAPAALFTACSFSYDPLGTGLCFLGLALAMDALMSPGVRLTALQGVGMLLCFTLGSITKTIYIPLILLLVMLPRSKFESKRSRLLFKSAAAALFAAVLMTRVLQTLADTALIEDARASASDSAGQLSFLVSHPFTYLGYFFEYLFSHFQLFFLNAWRVSLAYAGGLDDLTAAVSLLLLLFTAFTDHDDRIERSTLHWYQRLGMFGVAALVTGLAFTIMYIAYSPVGAKDFTGMQPRYLLPVIPLLFFLLSPDGIRNRMQRTGWALTFSLMNLAILAWTCVSLILVPWSL